MVESAQTSSPSPFDALDPARKRVAYERAAQKVREVRSTVLPTLTKILAEVKKRERLTKLIESIPPIFKPFLQRSRYKGAHGGRGSTKSQTFARLLVIRMVQDPTLRAVCIREIQKSLEQSVLRLITDVINLYGYQDKFKILNTHIETPEGGIIIFQGMQNHTADSIKSLEGYRIAWVEEAQSLSAKSLELLRPTMRAEDSELWFSWNPKDKTDPVDDLLRSRTWAVPDGIVIEANFKDNPYFPEVLRKEMEWDRVRDIDKYNHVWLGHYEKRSHARVFKNWKIEDFDTPEHAMFLFGGDWGFSVDPSVLVRGYADEPSKTLYIDFEAWSINCEIDDTPALFDSVGCTRNHEHTPEKIAQLHIPGSLCAAPYGLGVEDHCEGMARNWTTVADSARPETISYMQRHGYPLIQAAKKGAGSVEEGIKFLQSWNIVVHTRCKHVADELASYSYKIDPLTGFVTAILVDAKNHTIDSIRYMVEAMRIVLAEKVEVF